jgi:hypothetical protein
MLLLVLISEATRLDLASIDNILSLYDGADLQVVQGNGRQQIWAMVLG